ncbi:proton-conducting transporter transmembrane domain-containing protein [Cellulophaga baltica]|uniref:NAD(P)H-quinone oxidoreductase subunit 5 n=1 Tax=Cellulophaga baltica TaxID=76594 RepID=A0A1G7KUE5_9FLAO|nr:proton-conducting transporter membrane subunit [Cellulophaga baltica]SDF40694.1 NAD(P)H-quinone oxidoreductase subunit 5 [Cellulophaga baltica]
MNLNSNSISSISNQQNSTRTDFVSKMVVVFLWLLFGSNVLYLLSSLYQLPNWYYGDLFRINGFTLLIWTTVTFFSAVISTYARKYLIGFRFKSKFMILCLAFTAAVLLLVASNHVFLFLISWLLMGLLMSNLIGIDTTLGEAKQALNFTRNYFLAGTFFLVLGVYLLVLSSKETTLESITAVVFKLPLFITIPAGICIIIAAMIQSAIYPFHRWLLSAMTAPTPASALMHAGFVNGSGILLTLFASLLYASNSLNILLVIGAVTAIVAQFTKLLQTNVKHKLACSTIAQMGYMIMQCGLGFFNAAIVHLILHGFYKAYLFLSSGEEIGQTKVQIPLPLSIRPFQGMLVILFGLFGAYFFIILTGKGMKLDSGVFLTLIVAITVGQITYNIVKERSLSMFQKIIVPPILLFLGIVMYAFMYNGVTLLMGDMPYIAQPIPLTWLPISFGLIFLIGFFIMKLGMYKSHPWLYVKLLNLSQPYKNSVLMYKSRLK